MPAHTRFIALALSLSVLAPAGARAQGTDKTFTAMDTIEIQQLVAKYAYALDTHADNGYMYADLFAPDGTFGSNTKGREALAAVARNNQPDKSGPAATRHFLTNVIITPTAEGATGRQYMVLIDVGNASKPSAIDHGGFYEDVYVKTAAGWRFKSRNYTRSKLGPKPNPLPPSQSQNSGAASTGPALTAMDYIQIKQLANRFMFAFDTAADGGCAFADLFAADGEFQPGDVKGRDQLAALARFGEQKGPFNARLYGMNHVIEASPEGARGKQYVAEILHDNKIPPVPREQSQWNLVGQKRGEVLPVGGHYEDVYVKTADGWRFKRREFIASQGGPQPTRASLPPGKMPALPAGPACGPKKPAATASTLTPMDYLEIEKLIASYGHALDNGYGTGDNAEAYANLYTRDASFGATQGHDPLAQLGFIQPHSATYTRHYLANHVIEGTADGAIGKQYLAVLDIGEDGAPSSVFLGGHYEDVYAKTPAGWRIKKRTLYLAKTGPDAAAAPTR